MNDTICDTLIYDPTSCNDPINDTIGDTIIHDVTSCNDSTNDFTCDTVFHAMPSCNNPINDTIGDTLIYNNMTSCNDPSDDFSVDTVFHDVTSCKEPINDSICDIIHDVTSCNETINDTIGDTLICNMTTCNDPIDSIICNSLIRNMTSCNELIRYILIHVLVTSNGDIYCNRLILDLSVINSLFFPNSKAISIQEFSFTLYLQYPYNQYMYLFVSNAKYVRSYMPMVITCRIDLFHLSKLTIGLCIFLNNGLVLFHYLYSCYMIYNGLSRNAVCVSDNIDCCNLVADYSTNVTNFSPISTSCTVQNGTNFGFIPKGFHIACLNVRHLMPKIDEIELLLTSPETCHIFGLCETFLNQSTTNKELTIPGYNHERRDRSGKKGGGLIVYIKQNIQYTRRLDIETVGVECIWLLVNIVGSKPFLLGFYYRPPNSISDWFNSFDAELNNADSIDLDMFILGDFNLNFFPDIGFKNNKWESLLLKYGLTQLVSTPTRVTNKTSSIIDHIYTNSSQNISHYFVSNISISDHYPVCLTIKGKLKHPSDKQHTSIKYRCYKKFDEKLFCRDLLCSNISSIEMITDPNDALAVFYSIFNAVLSNHAPMKEKRIKRPHQPGWYNDEIRKARLMRNKFHTKKDWKQYNYWRNKTTQLIKDSKKNFFNDAVREHKDTNSMWQGLKSIMRTQNNTGPVIPKCIKVNNKDVTDTIEILNSLNSHFVNISQDIQKTALDPNYYIKLKHILDRKLGDNIFEIPFITPNEVQNYIKNLNNNKSTGIDNIGPRILKSCIDIITVPLTSVINNSIANGIFPDQLKIAHVLPLFKKGEKDDLNNYRPISILPTLSKIFEKHIATQIHKFLKKTSIIHTSQSGFRQYHSCQTALINLTEKWLGNIDNGNTVGVVFLDLKKAFDLVNHDLLIKKLELYHFSNRTIKLFSSYLNNRKQQVKQGLSFSNTETIVSGVPQGSILGPLLFLIYINDLPFFTKKSELDMFADDSTLSAYDKNIKVIETNLQLSVNEVSIWCKYNCMAINPQKTTCMILNSSKRSKSTSNLNIEIDNVKLEQVKTHKLLGAFVDENLLWSAQVQHVCKTLTNKINLLKRINYFLTAENKQLFYNSYILSCFDYACITWSTCSKNEFHKIEKLQKRAARIILKKPIKTPSIFMFKELNWLSFSNRLKYHIALLVYKSTKGLVPVYISNIIQFSSNDTYNMRSKSNIKIKQLQCNTNFQKKTFSYLSIQVWNNLPLSLKLISNIQNFKRSLKNHLFNLQLVE